MWFLNKQTGLKWHITDKELQERLLKNPDYEQVLETENQSEKVEEELTEAKSTRPKRR